MIGAIVLTHRRRDGVRRQKVSDQIRRRAEETVELRKVPIGKGI
jgi:NADH-quinone oxidoreductase subunit J